MKIMISFEEEKRKEEIMKTTIFAGEYRLLRSIKRSALPGLLIAVFVVGAAAAASGPILARNVHLVGHFDFEGGGMVDVR